MSKLILEVKNITKKFSYSENVGVNDVSFSIEEGKIFSLLGPSGCGKSTLLRIIAGLEALDAGQVFIDGKDVTKMPPYQRPVNMMFQSYALFPHMTVKDNIAFGLRQEKLNDSEIESRVMEALDMVGMVEFMHRMPNQISGGQQQRVAFARSIIKRPKILLLDEPISALDKKNREKAQMELIKIQNKLNITFLIVTHDQEEAMAMSDCMAVMNNGALIQMGTPEQIYELPNSLFVADFVGSINIFSGQISESSGKVTRIVSEEAGTEIYIKEKYPREVGKKVWFAVRPEEMSIHSSPRNDDANQVHGEILDIGFLGTQIIYHVALPSGKIVNVTVPSSALSKNPNLDWGKKAYLTWHDTDGVILEK
jgi:putrescine transport system ATP-binding protein